jgi:2-oxoglutarate ferredoxin oxidoreductase subunit alpha
MYALGIVYWLYDRPLDATIAYLEQEFTKGKNKPQLADINIRALKAGYYFGETAELFPARYHVAPAKIQPGTYRKISGNEAAALGFVAAAHKQGRQAARLCQLPDHARVRHHSHAVAIEEPQRQNVPGGG